MKSKIAILIALICVIKFNSVASSKCIYGYSFGYTCFFEPDSSDEIDQHLRNQSDLTVKIVDINGTLNEIEHLSELELSPLCDKFKNLEKVKIYGNIKTVSDDLFKNCHQLTFIEITRTKIEKLAENLFFNQRKLEKLDLKSNKLKELPEKLFANQRQLKFLALLLNFIPFLPPNIFKSQEKLETLFIGGNELTELPKNIFKSLINLKELYLWHNKLTTIHADSFDVNKKLKRINLSFNQIDSIDEELINITAIETLEMRRNVCINEDIVNRQEMMEKLQKCFNNYKPRENNFGEFLVIF